MCVYKPPYVHVLAKRNYANKNEKIKITILINVKEEIKIKEKKTNLSFYNSVT